MPNGLSFTIILVRERLAQYTSFARVCRAICKENRQTGHESLDPCADSFYMPLNSSVLLFSWTPRRGVVGFSSRVAAG